MLTNGDYGDRENARRRGLFVSQRLHAKGINSNPRHLIVVIVAFAYTECI
jgi:hypothetical protein